MCSARIANTAAIVAGAGSTGGILAMCIRKFENFLQSESSRFIQDSKEKQNGN
jgi:hypothetical protein